MSDTTTNSTSSLRVLQAPFIWFLRVFWSFCGGEKLMNCDRHQINYKLANKYTILTTDFSSHCGKLVAESFTLLVDFISFWWTHFWGFVFSCSASGWVEKHAAIFNWYTSNVLNTWLLVSFSKFTASHLNLPKRGICSKELSFFFPSWKLFWKLTTSFKLNTTT